MSSSRSSIDGTARMFPKQILRLFCCATPPNVRPSARRGSPPFRELPLAPSSCFFVLTVSGCLRALSAQALDLDEATVEAARLGHACCTVMADIRAAVRALQLQAEQASEERELIRASLEQVLEASSSAYADHATEVYTRDPVYYTSSLIGSTGRKFRVCRILLDCGPGPPRGFGLPALRIYAEPRLRGARRKRAAPWRRPWTLAECSARCTTRRRSCLCARTSKSPRRARAVYPFAPLSRARRSSARPPRAAASRPLAPIRRAPLQPPPTSTHHP